MDIQTSDALYRRHENEWAAFRDAVQQKSRARKAMSLFPVRPFRATSHPAGNSPFHLF
ncbi:hypothetical protein HED51_00860 [Ochrobactrum grignonense]|nr:hypothetical protein [Brucella grignonensis]